LVSGGEVVTLDLLQSLEPSVHAVLACPEGPLAERARAVGVTVAPVAGMAGSLKLHPVETPRAVKDLTVLGRAIARLARRTAADVVFAASIRAGLAASLPVGRRPPLVVGLHDCLPAGRATSGTKRVVDHAAAALVANSRYTARAWRDGGGDPPIRVLHPPIDLDRFERSASRTEARRRLGLPGAAPLLGVVAQITPWKGQDTAVRALARLRERHPDAELVLAGGTTFTSRATRFDNRTYLAGLERLVAELGLDRHVHFLGPCDDVSAVLASLDVLLVPSWEEPFGLVMVEAMAAGTPVMATSVGGPPEVITDRVDGRLVPPEQPAPWADAAADLLDDAADRDRLVTAGRETARRFAPDAYAEAVVDVWASAATGGR
jgi:glycosyltransferase involved in cell wall biosynthesis